jgi:hypothetical protein
VPDRAPGICGIAATRRDCLLDDLQNHEESTGYGEGKRNAAIAGESRACEIRLDRNNSSEKYLNARPLSRPMRAFCCSGDPDASSGDKSRSWGILGSLEGILANAVDARPRLRLSGAKGTMDNSNGINGLNNLDPLESVISESHTLRPRVETLLGTSLRQWLRSWTRTRSLTVFAL